MEDTLELTRNLPAKAELRLFGLTNMMETMVANMSRVYLVWEHASPHFEFIAKANKSLGISAMTSIIINILNYFKDKQVSVIGWEKNEWQALILAPLKNSISIESITEVVGKLHYIIESCGPFIERRGWEVVLGILERVIDPLPSNVAPPSDFGQRLGHAFKCVEYICHNSLFKVHVSSVNSLIAIVWFFTTLQDSLNIPLLSVAFIQNIADYLSQQQVSGKLVNTPQEKISEIWVILFTRLKEIGTDQRPDLRHTAYRTLDQIMDIHGKDLGVRVWSYILGSSAAELLQFLAEGYFESIKNENASEVLQEGTPAAAEGKLIEVKNWEESIRVLCISLVRIVKKLHSLEESVPM